MAKLRSDSPEKRGEATICQRRFWEHTLRDERDLQRHMDYIQDNPVKHGLAQRVKDWQWSSYYRYARMGYYDAEWGGDNGKYDPLAFGE